MSWLSKYVFDPVKAALARQANSQNPVSSAAGKAGLDAVKNIAAVTVTAVDDAITHRSAVGLSNPIVGALEDGLKNIVDATLTAGLGQVPIAGALITPEAVNVADMGLNFLEQHAATYLAGLFHHARTQNVASPAAAGDQQQQ